MAIVVVNSADLLALDDVRLGSWDSPVMHLYKNNLSPTVTSVLGNFVEADYPGYGPLPYVWTSVHPNIAGFAEIDSTLPLTFTRAGGGPSQTVYGYYVVAGGELLYAERASAPIVFAADGDFVVILARFSAQSLFTG